MEAQQQLDELVRATRTMRQAQKKYFRSRTTTALSESKIAEAAVDRLLQQHPEPAQPVQAELGFSTSHK
ncbi:hypothetical protein [Spirosoma sordidisoli]|uniref:Uncharacterized protein n=1 Tax=Spirosoma sordidisoli TaxID=2502893 RepID=A0A4Q2UQ54_9BACT|nr:hypothetical protein [Spirosoma sordidisoli]RYC69775.1 hypothetical protein EQG79_14365 [Spirosoma sordidisoli]